MSYDELAAHASQIYEKAIDAQMEERGFIKNQHGYQGGAGMTDEIAQDILNQTEADFADVPTLFADFTQMPDPSSFAPLYGSVEGAMHKLSSGEEGASDPLTGSLFPFNVNLKDMTTAADYLDEWDGLAMMEFVENFATPFPARCLNQFAAASVLQNALRAEEALWTAARADVDKIAHEVISALDGLGECGKNEWTGALSVVAAVITVGAATVASGGTAAIALAFAGAATSVASTAAGQMEEEPKPEYSGDTAKAVIDACRSALDDLKTSIENAEKKIQDALVKANGTLQSSGGENYVAPKPSLLDQDKPDPGYPDRD